MTDQSSLREETKRRKAAEERADYWQRRCAYLESEIRAYFGAKKELQEHGKRLLETAS
jgi:hypothetical protein